MRASASRTLTVTVSLLALLAGGAVVGPAAAQKLDLTKPAGKEWRAPQGDWNNSRYSTLSQITPANAKQLGGAWTYKFEAGMSRAIPLVADGRLYITVGKQVLAFNAKDGRLLWKHDTPIPPSVQFKGVAYGDGMIYYGTADARIVALDAKTGELKWSTLIGDEGLKRGEGEGIAALTITGQYISGAPTYVNGKIITGMSNGDFGIRGRVVALDARSGKKAWHFDTVPGPGEEGHETWPSDNEEWKQGGGGAWSTPAVDPELGLAIFGVGNPVPQWGGELRKGDNLYTDSVVALDINTGNVRWHFQATRHDIWEADLGTPMVLYDAVVDGKKRKAVAAMHTNSFLFLLDRTTGEPIHPIEEKAFPQNPRLFTSPTQPIPVGVDPIAPLCISQDIIPEGFKGMCMYDPIDYTTPNAMYPVLATRAAPLAYSPDTGYFYAAAAIWPYWVQRYEDPKFFTGGASVPGIKYSSILAAVDSKTNKVVWRKKVPGEIQNGSGFTATKGGVIFHGSPDGNFQALDAKNGDLLWQFQTGSPQNGPAAVYEIDGEQYVAAVSDGALWAFKLGGTVQPAAAPPPPRTESAWAGRVTRTDKVAMAAVVKDSGLEKIREAYDEFVFEPMRIRVKAGTKVTFTNNGKTAHEAKAVDGSWSTGKLKPGQSAVVTFDKAGSITYQCADHKWSYGQVIVDP